MANFITIQSIIEFFVKAKDNKQLPDTWEPDTLDYIERKRQYIIKLNNSNSAENLRLAIHIHGFIKKKLSHGTTK